MKTILVDGISGLILKNGTIHEAMYKLLEEYPNPKLVLTGANDDQWQKFNLDISPYEVFTLKHNPEKTDPEYFNILFETIILGLTMSFFLNIAKRQLRQRVL